MHIFVLSNYLTSGTAVPPFTFVVAARNSGEALYLVQNHDDKVFADLELNWKEIGHSSLVVPMMISVQRLHADVANLRGPKEPSIDYRLLPLNDRPGVSYPGSPVPDDAVEEIFLAFNPIRRTLLLGRYVTLPVKGKPDTPPPEVETTITYVQLSPRLPADIIRDSEYLMRKAEHSHKFLPYPEVNDKPYDFYRRQVIEVAAISQGTLNEDTLLKQLAKTALTPTASMFPRAIIPNLPDGFLHFSTASAAEFVLGLARTVNINRKLMMDE